MTGAMMTVASSMARSRSLSPIDCASCRNCDATVTYSYESKSTGRSNAAGGPSRPSCAGAPKHSSSAAATYRAAYLTTYPLTPATWPASARNCRPSTEEPSICDSVSVRERRSRSPRSPTPATE
eukprot:2283982-Pleurochrysis_carterae.AAC.2